MFGALAICVFCALPMFASARTTRGVLAGFFGFMILAVLCMAQAISALIGPWPTMMAMGPVLETGGIGPVIAVPVILIINAFLWLGPVATACLWAAGGLYFAALTFSAEYLRLLHVIDCMRDH